MLIVTYAYRALSGKNFMWYGTDKEIVWTNYTVRAVGTRVGPGEKHKRS
jgi:hypothetical protein